MKNLFLLLALICTYTISLGQSPRDEFIKYFQQGNTEKQLSVLQQWEKDNPTDADLFACYFNYYIIQARQEVLSLSSKDTNEEELVVQDSAGEVVGFIGSQIIYKEVFLKKAFEKIDRGITLHPNRLDLRFGKIYTLGEAKMWEDFTSEIIKTIDYSSENQNAWTWTLNEKKTDGKLFFLSSIQGYQNTLYDANDNALLTNMRTISEAVLKHYPKHMESLSNIAITHLIQEEYPEAIKHLKKAVKIAPKDVIILNNLALCYQRQGNKKSAIKYYKKMIKYADESTIQYAEQKIKELEE